MKKNNSFVTKFFTKDKMVGLLRYLITSLSICVLMAGIECTVIYAVEVTRFDKFVRPSNGKMVGMSGWVWGRDYGIALAIAWPLSWILTNLIPWAFVTLLFKPMEQKHGAPNKGQKIGGFIAVTFTICFFESLIMSLIMFTIDTRVVLPKYMDPIFQSELGINFPTDWIAGHWARVWGLAIGVCFPAALVITSLVPMGWKKLFAKIDKKKLAKASVPYNETTLKGKVEYLEDEDDDVVKESKKH